MVKDDKTMLSSDLLILSLQKSSNLASLHEHLSELHRRGGLRMRMSHITHQFADLNPMSTDPSGYYFQMNQCKR